MNGQETLRLRSLELAVQHLGKDAHNLETVLQWADEFYKWLAQDGEPVQDKDVVSRRELKEELRFRLKSAQDFHWHNTDKQVGYTDAIEDVLQIIDEL